MTLNLATARDVQEALEHNTGIIPIDHADAIFNLKAGQTYKYKGMTFTVLEDWTGYLA